MKVLFHFASRFIKSFAFFNVVVVVVCLFVCFVCLFLSFFDFSLVCVLSYSRFLCFRF